MAEAILSRPDGRAYRPQKAGLRAHAWENVGHCFDERAGVIVFGTLDPEEARPLAQESAALWFGDADIYRVAEPAPGWWRDGYSAYGRTWIEDTERGAPGVMFTWAEVNTGSQPSEGAQA